MQTIEYTILEGNLGDFVTRQQAENYRETLEEVIRAEYPDAEVKVNLKYETSGCAPVPMCTGFDNDENTEKIIKIISEGVFEKKTLGRIRSNKNV